MPFNILRREFIAVLGGAAASPLSARAQQLPGRTARIGLLQTSRGNPVVARGYPAFLDELKKSGFSVGQNLTIEVVRTDRDSQRLFAETADLVRSNVELLVAEGSEIVLEAALAASRTIPIVISATNYDPIARGYVKSLARPGGNITGIVSLQTELAAKQVELLTEAFPDRSRLAVLYDEDSADQFAGDDVNGGQIGRQEILQSAAGLFFGDGAGDERRRDQGQEDEVLRQEDFNEMAADEEGVLGARSGHPWVL